MGFSRGPEAVILPTRAHLMVAKEPVEGYLQIIVIILFALGSLLAGIGRTLEMDAGPERR